VSKALTDEQLMIDRLGDTYERALKAEAERDEAREVAKVLLQRLVLLFPHGEKDVPDIDVRAEWEKKHSWLKERP
jgi:hypothetical protein